MFKELLNAFHIEDDIIVVGFQDDETDHDRTLYRVPQICKEENLKLNMDKCHFRCISIPIFGKIISRYGVKPDSPGKLHALTEMPPFKTTKEVQSFIATMNSLSLFSAATAEVCEPTMQAVICQSRKDIEQVIQRPA